MNAFRHFILVNLRVMQRQIEAGAIYSYLRHLTFITLFIVVIVVCRWCSYQRRTATFQWASSLGRLQWIRLGGNHLPGSASTGDIGPMAVEFNVSMAVYIQPSISEVLVAHEVILVGGRSKDRSQLCRRLDDASAPSSIWFLMTFIILIL